MEKVKRRRFSSAKVRIVLGAALALLAFMAVTLSIHRYRQPEAAPPEALAHIAERNHDAAIAAAAHQRVESAASTNAAEDLADAQRRGADQANAMLARFPDTDNRASAEVRRD